VKLPNWIPRLAHNKDIYHLLTLVCSPQLSHIPLCNSTMRQWVDDRYAGDSCMLLPWQPWFGFCARRSRVAFCPWYTTVCGWVDAPLAPLFVCVWHLRYYNRLDDLEVIPFHQMSPLSGVLLMMTGQASQQNNHRKDPNPLCSRLQPHWIFPFQPKLFC